MGEGEGAEEESSVAVSGTRAVQGVAFSPRALIPRQTIEGLVYGDGKSDPPPGAAKS